ncbi:hypothetical protein ACHFJ0_21860 [Paracoccus sp. NGMCC 1.201697]|uniref:Uncharacterized protein n=1 Tax=Paracoccus broussonetiae subsp. drimophilus TaxID=3373869 RepID=A0ABW7LRE9_9RHOB
MKFDIKSAEHTFLDASGYWLEGMHYTDDTLVVTFENLSGGIYRPNGYREGWGSGFFRKREVSHLCVKPLYADWYQGENLALGLTALKKSGYFRRYKRVISYGGSMGGFGALAYSDLIGANTVLAINPQSTMSLKKVPWETRFKVAQRQAWTGKFSDANGKYKLADNVIIYADMRYDMDARQVERLKGENVTIVNSPFLGHQLPYHFQVMGVLGKVVDHAIAGSKDLSEMRLAMRKRRYSQSYYRRLIDRDRVRSSPTFLKIVRTHQISLNREIKAQREARSAE